MGLLCGVGALVLLAIQAVGRPMEGSAQPPTAPTRLPPSAFSPVRLPQALVEALRARPDDGVGSPGGGASPENRFGEPGPVRSADGSGASPLPASTDAAAVVPDRVLVGLQPPAVVRFRPRDGSRGVDPNAWLSVRFTAPMDRAATERAFSVLVDGDPVRGRTWWAEDDTVLVLDPAAPLPSGAEVRMAVSAAARSRVGLALVAPATATIRVAASVVTPRSEPSRTAGSSTSGSTSTSGWRWPLLGPITQRFGESLTRYGWHAGIDIDGSTGDPVVAARAGRVTVAGVYDACGGLEVHIDHGDGFESWYRHLSLVEVAVGARVAAGARIGRVGNTGCSLGSHLHFAIRL
ncbi:MAG TPA: peptidoglycan DD-metalloendopeptidase family protein, partial [Candidatus Binatia bacterium]|nr:peptidoglycan DD-metalloendopeptidase family protein [Candidatus Binatia bacterium]